MRYPISWLKDYVDITLSPEDLAEKLTQAGLEVEAVTHLGQDLCGIVSGRITDIQKHPDADRLQITHVFDGETTHQIVTGAQNIFMGAIVPVSLPGAVLANGLKIKPSKLRGVPSNGMLCSQAELGMVESAEGIWLLPEDTPLGVDMLAYAGLRDVILEIGILPNRGDCLSIYGMAREIAAVLHLPLKPLETDISILSALVIPDISLADVRCSQYVARRLHLSRTMIKTPLWMERRLALCGLRSLSLPVDITNYVLLETGQPLHAFDMGKLKGDISVLGSRVGTMIQTLDEQVHELPEGTLIVADESGPLAIAGVMGGLQSAVTANTSDILLEAAVFDPVSVRRTGTRLGLRTESAIRFEKGVDWKAVSRASDRAAHLFVKLAGAHVGGTTVVTHPQAMSAIRTIPCDFAKINTLLGTDFSEQEMTGVLQSVGVSVSEGQAVVPSWRFHDLVDWPCLAEEIARLLGYDRIPETLPDRWVPLTEPTALQKAVVRAESFWIARGYQQVCTFSMISPEDFEKTRIPLPSDALYIRNPLAPDASILRRYLMPSLLEVAGHHAKRQVDSLRIFEVGKVFWLSEDGIQENQVSGMLVYGPLAHTYKQDQKDAYDLDFSYLKGLVDAFMTDFGFSNLVFKPSKYPQYHPYASADIFFSDVLIGNVGYLHPDVTEAYGVTQRVGYIGLNLTAMAKFDEGTIRFSSFSRFPSTRRDVAMLVDRKLSYADIDAAIKASLPKSVTSYYLFDAYEGASLGDNKKSLGFAFVYQDPEKTLSDDDVNAVHERFVETLQATLPIGLR
jgi:phenylalanyl-tRNA synthetase beta chain